MCRESCNATKFPLVRSNDRFIEPGLAGSPRSPFIWSVTGVHPAEAIHEQRMGDRLNNEKKKCFALDWDVAASIRWRRGSAGFNEGRDRGHGAGQTARTALRSVMAGRGELGKAERRCGRQSDRSALPVRIVRDRAE